MNLAGIISISGKPGLYRVIAQGKNNLIVENLEDKKRVPAYATDRISSLEDISIYTYDDDKPLKEIYTTLFEKEKGKETISHKEDAAKLQKYLLEILPNFDQERVYPSDIKKLFQWYNILLKAGALVPEVTEEADDSTSSSTEKKPAAKAKATKKADASTGSATDEAKEETPKKAPAAKKAPAKAAATKSAVPKAASKAAPKATTAKKAAAPKTGVSRGK